MLNSNPYRTPVENCFCVYKQLFADVPLNKCSEKFRKFERKAPVLESVLNKVAGLHFVKKRLQRRCYLVKFAKFLRTLSFTEHLFTVTASACSENLRKILVRSN